MVGEDIDGDVRLHADFPSRIMGGPRSVVVYLPPGYDACRDRFPVLYAHDGQNLFDHRTSFCGKWDLDGAAQRLIRSGQLRGVIIVGVYNSPYRMSEYTPVPDEDHPEGGGAERYGRFLVEELKPFIDRHYRTLDGPSIPASWVIIGRPGVALSRLLLPAGLRPLRRRLSVFVVGR